MLSVIDLSFWTVNLPLKEEEVPVGPRLISATETSVSARSRRKYDKSPAMRVTVTAVINVTLVTTVEQHCFYSAFVTRRSRDIPRGNRRRRRWN